MNVEPVSAQAPACAGASISPAAQYLIVGRSAAHQWIVKDSRGRIGAVFRWPDVALRFARREAKALGCSVVIDRDAAELDCLARS